MTPDLVFTSESVTAGHPDKLCDQISDAAIDAFLSQDAGARAVIECAVATGVVFIAARYAADASVDLTSLARRVIADAGYLGQPFDARKCSILTNVSELPLAMRSAVLAPAGDPAALEHPAEDQANAFGYACRDTPELMPAPISLAHRLAQALDAARRAGAAWLSPDGKTQVSVEYRLGRPLRIRAISLTVALTADRFRQEIDERLRFLALEALKDGGLAPDAETEFHINAGRAYEGGGPEHHAGLTGRKTGIDTYGEIARHSGAALSGKDPSRIDRTGAYAARHAAKNVVAAGLAERCEVHVAYAIGRAQPLSVSVETFGSGRVSDREITRRLLRVADFRPAVIERRFALRTRPGTGGNNGFYRPLAVYGHFGRPGLALPWEATDLADALRG